MSNVLKTLVSASTRLALVQKEMEAKRFVGSAGGNLVQVTISGQHEPKSVVIAPEVLKEDPTTVAELVLAALNSAYNQVNTETKEKTASVSKALSPFGLRMPG